MFRPSHRIRSEPIFLTYACASIRAILKTSSYTCVVFNLAGSVIWEEAIVHVSPEHVREGKLEKSK